jgi:mono/diheme cytochrome c family protein
MTRTIAAGLILCGGLLVWVMRSSPNQNAADVESTRLIESIQGPALYSAYCAVCHGKDGRGSGPMASSLKSRTPDLTRIAARNRGTFPLTRIQRIISGEEQIEAGHGTREMPVWGPVFSQVAWDQDLGRIRLYNLAKYIETLQGR